MVEGGGLKKQNILLTLLAIFDEKQQGREPIMTCREVYRVITVVVCSDKHCSHYTAKLHSCTRVQKYVNKYILEKNNLFIVHRARNWISSRRPWERIIPKTKNYFIYFNKNKFLTESAFNHLKKFVHWLIIGTESSIALKLAQNCITLRKTPLETFVRPNIWTRVTYLNGPSENFNHGINHKKYEIMIRYQAFSMIGFHNRWKLNWYGTYLHRWYVHHELLDTVAARIWTPKIITHLILQTFAISSNHQHYFQTCARASGQTTK